MQRTFTLMISFLLVTTLANAQSQDELLTAAQAFPPMPATNGELRRLLGNPNITIAAGTPYNDLEYTLFDTDYIDGETSGYDTFCPADPSDPVPGADRINFVLCTTNTLTDSVYDRNGGDRVILGLPERPEPFFLRGPDGVDNDYVIIRHFDFRSAVIQLAGTPDNYQLRYFTPADGVATEGYYLFYRGAGDPDLVAFIFPCWDVDPPRRSNQTVTVCNDDRTLQLDDPNRFVFVNQPVGEAVYPDGLTQVGSTGKDLVHGITTDAQGAMYLFGSGDGNLDNQSDPGHELFVIKLDASGQQQWATELAQPDGALLWDGEASDGYLYVAGRTLGALPNRKNAGGWDGIILKLDTQTGEIIATDQWGNAGLDGYGNLTLDDAGNLFVSGAGSPPGTALGDSAYVVAKHRTSDLTNVWRLITPADQTASRVAEGWGGLTYIPGDAPGAGKLVTGGWYISPAQPPGGAQGFVALFDNLDQATPRQVAVQTVGTPGFRADWVIDNVVDEQGYIYAAGFTTGDLPGSQQQGRGDAFVMRFDPDLTNPKAVQFGTPYADQIRKIQVGNNGMLYATGYTYGDLSAPNADPSHRTGDVFIQQLDSDLTLLKSVQLGTSGEERGFLHIRDSTLYLSGVTERAFTGAYQGSFDGFVLTLGANDLASGPISTLPDDPSPASDLLIQARAYAAQPASAVDIILPSPSRTFGSGTPYNDILYTALNTTYMEGETAGYDYFFPADPGDTYPGDRLMMIRTVNNLDLVRAYEAPQGDQIVLGTDASENPFFLAGEDGVDNEWVVIVHFDYRSGRIQLKGQPDDYELLYATPEEGVATEGYYLFYTAGDIPDLVAFIYPCDFVVPPVSGTLPQDPTILCNSSGTLDLGNPEQFVYAQPIDATPAVPEAVAQPGTPSNDLIHGSTTDQQGNVYLYGSSYGSFGGGSAASENAFLVVKLDRLGNQLWANEVPGDDGALIFDAVADEQYLYAAGRTHGAISGFVSNGQWDAVILKIDLETGQLVDSDQWGNRGIDGYGNITLDDAGDLLLSGAGSPPDAEGTDAVHLIAKHRAATLDNVWRVFDAPDDTPAFVSEAWGGITYVPGNAPGDGRVIITGWYMGRGAANTFISVYEELNQDTPERRYTTTLTSPGQQADWPLDNAVDSQGNIYIAGYTTGNLGGTPAGDGDFFVAKYNPQLEDPQIIQMGTPQSDAFRKLVIDEEDNLYALGYTYGNYQGANADPTLTTGDVVVQKLDTDLNLLSAQQFGTGQEDRGFLHYANRTLYVSGTTEGSLAQANQGGLDGFLVYLESDNLEIIPPSVLSSDDPKKPRRPRRPRRRFGRWGKVYPNPSIGPLIVKFNAALRKACTYSIIDYLGNVRMHGQGQGERMEIDISRLSAGVYCLKIDLGDESISTRIIKR